MAEEQWGRSTGRLQKGVRRIPDCCRRRDRGGGPPGQQPLQLDIILRKGGQLFQLYVVDEGSKMETDRLSYHRDHQGDLRAHRYSGLTNALRVGEAPGDVGRRVVLASSFVGGPRYMVQQYQDAMSIERKYGKPPFSSLSPASSGTCGGDDSIQRGSSGWTVSTIYCVPYRLPQHT